MSKILISKSDLLRGNMSGLKDVASKAGLRESQTKHLWKSLKENSSSQGINMDDFKRTLAREINKKTGPLQGRDVRKIAEIIGINSSAITKSAVKMRHEDIGSEHEKLGSTFQTRIDNLRREERKSAELKHNSEAKSGEHKEAEKTSDAGGHKSEAGPKLRSLSTQEKSIENENHQHAPANDPGFHQAEKATPDHVSDMLKSIQEPLNK